MSTRAQVDAMIPVFLAALREAGYPVADSYAWAEEYPDGWRFAWWPHDIPKEVNYRAAMIALTSIGETISCWWCWSHQVGLECSLGDCRAPSEVTR